MPSVVISPVPVDLGTTSGTTGGTTSGNTIAPSIFPLNLAGLLQKLSFGPLSNLAIGMDGAGTCDPNKIPALVGHINEGLLHLFSKFVLNERNMIIQMSEVITQYKLTSARARSNPSSDPLQFQYIIDSASDPFTDDLLKVLQVFDDAGREIILNDQSVYGSIFTPQFNVLQIPIPVDGQPLYISYQAKHTILNSTDLNQLVDVPDVLIEALVAYTAHKVFFHMNGQEHSIKAKEHLDKFNMIVAEVLDKDLLNSSISTNRLTKFHERGFV